MRALTTVAAGVLCVALPASAITYSNFPIDGLQAVPPNVTPGFGSGTVELVDQTPAPDDWALTWNITYQDLMGDITLSHFHGPGGYGVNAGARVLIPLSPGGATSGSLIGNAVISDAFATELMSGLWYVNIHTTFDAGGEIRGQVVPEPTALVLLCGGAVALVGRRRRRA